MTKTDTQSHCEEKIRFLQSKSTNKEVLPLPDKMLPTNIIQHESLPKATEKRSSLDLVNALRRTERLPIVFLKQNLSIVKQALSYPDSTIFEQKSQREEKDFCRVFELMMRTLKEVFAERNIGNSPDIDCPEQLTREIGRRLRLCLMGPRTFKPYHVQSI
ncbi:unnamed protein product [Mytilus coruscus]|uniref:Uncharacterized protein n=1 Tax=Mytilus coruscus TaxID=42192 RepID=A0A6J8CZG5_MYTCO|nr:unnamed protein product [Mytilus coruscus]